MSTLNGTLGGTLIGSETQIPKDSNIRDAIIKTVTQLGECSSYRIGYQNDTVPYDMSWDTGSTVWDILTELRDLYYNYEMFLTRQPLCASASRWTTENLLYWITLCLTTA